MFKNKNIDFSGEIVIDELFTDINRRKQYTVSIFANEIKDMPIAVAIMNTRHFDVMWKFFEFIFKDTPFKALTSDMLGVYKKIATNAKVPHQQCVFHWMKYNGKKIRDEFKKEKHSERDKIDILMKFTEMKEILRCFDHKEVEKKGFGI